MAVIADNCGGLFDGGDDLDTAVSNTASAESVGLHDVPVCDPASFDLDTAVSNTISIELVSSDNTKRIVDRPLAASEALAEQLPEERFAEEVNLYDFPCDGNDQAPPHRVTTTATSSPATSTSLSATSPASARLASIALTPASSAAALFAEMTDEVDEQQIPAASRRWPRPATPSSPRSVPRFSPRTPSPQRHSVLDAEDHAASRLRALAENRALKQALARREGELQLVQMKYADEACMLTVVQGHLKELTEDTVPRNMPDRCLMNCLILSRSCFSFPFSWDAVICWQRRPWPPPSGPQSVSCEAELRPLPRPSFNMVERYFVMSASSRLWKPPWYVSTHQHISYVLPEPVEIRKCLMKPRRLVVIPVLVDMCLLDSEMMTAYILIEPKLVHQRSGSVVSRHILAHYSIDYQCSVVFELGIQIKIIVSLIFWNHTHIILVFVDTRTEALKLFCQMNFQLTAPWPSPLSCCQKIYSQTARPCFRSWQCFNCGLADGQLRQPWPPPAVALVPDIVMQQSKPWPPFSFYTVGVKWTVLLQKVFCYSDWDCTTKPFHCELNCDCWKHCLENLVDRSRWQGLATLQSCFVKYCWVQWEIPWPLATLVWGCGDRLSVTKYLQKLLQCYTSGTDGYLFEIIQRAGTPEPLCRVMLRVGSRCSMSGILIYFFSFSFQWTKTQNVTITRSLQDPSTLVWLSSNGMIPRLVHMIATAVLNQVEVLQCLVLVVHQQQLSDVYLICSIMNQHHNMLLTEFLFRSNIFLLVALFLEFLACTVPCMMHMVFVNSKEYQPWDPGIMVTTFTCILSIQGGDNFLKSVGTLS